MILFTGGSGLLGGEIKKHMELFAPNHDVFDILNPPPVSGVDLVIHAAAYTDLIKAETTHRKECYETNVVGTYNMVKMFSCPFVYISTEYVYNPLNHYSHTKLEGEYIVRNMCDKYLIIRTLFKPNPFPHEKAFVDQFTRGDYVDVIAPMIADEIHNWGGESKTIDVVTERKTMFDLAERTRDVGEMKVGDIKEVILPKDYLCV